MFTVVAATQEALGSNPWATASTYCFVANCNADTGSCVTATEVKPPKVRLDAPKAIAVVPTVTDEFVRLAFAMLVSVLVEPLIDLLVSVCDPVSVATVLSMAMVTAVDPLKDVPERPVPMVRALVVLAVTVVDPPKLTEFPFMVIELLVRLALPMLLSVLDEPLMVLFVNV